MSEEMELIAIDWPPDEAFEVCREKRADGTLAQFMEQQRRAHRERAIRAIRADRE